MQIHFVWIYSFDNLEKTGINFSSKFLIELNENNADQYILTINPNPDYIPFYFKENNVTNVNALVGKNGTGKSSVLRYIKANLPSGVNSRMKDDLIVYSVFDHNAEEIYHIAEPESMNLEIINNTGYTFENRKYNNIQFDSQLDNCTYIYYNYMFEYGARNRDMAGLFDISTSSLIRKERKKLLEDSSQVENNQLFLAKTNDLDFLHLQEVFQALLFLTHTNVEIPFEKPSLLHVNIENSDKHFLDPEKDKDLVELLNILQQRKPEHEETKDLFISNLLDALFLNYLTTERKYGIGNPYFTIALEPSENSDDYILRFFTSMRGATYHNVNVKKDILVDRWNQLGTDVPEFIKVTSEMLDKKKIHVTDKFDSYFLMDKEAADDFEIFQRLYMRVIGLTPFLKFRWRALSAGEQSYLSLMSRFYSILHEEVEINRNLCILIDEGDIGFHPEWQRKFFKTTIEFLSNLFSEYNIQIIFTSNTPFITSDLLKSNIIFISKGTDGKTEFLCKKNTRENTFAANIHTLFSDAFYMNGVLIGEYAKDKVNIEIIEYLKNVQIGQLPNPKIKSLIKNIGEPILRKKLEEMWNNAFGLQEELEMLKQRIQEVEHKIENREN